MSMDEKFFSAGKAITKTAAVRTAVQLRSSQREVESAAQGQGECPTDYGEEKLRTAGEQLGTDARQITGIAARQSYAQFRTFQEERRKSLSIQSGTHTQKPLQPVVPRSDWEAPGKTIKQSTDKRLEQGMGKLKRQIFRRRAVRKYLKKTAERAGKTAVSITYVPLEVPAQSGRQMAAQQIRRTAVWLFQKAKQLTVVLVKGGMALIAALCGAGVVLVPAILFLAIVAVLLASPMGILFANESEDPNSIPIGEIVLEANTEFGEFISALVEDHPECSNVEFHYEYEDGHTWASYWPEVLAVFAVHHNLNGDDDVIVLDREKADLLIDTFWAMHRIESAVAEVEITGENGEEGNIQLQYVLNITITSVPVDELARDLAFTEDQMDILHQLLSDELRPMLVQLCGTGISTGTGVPPIGDGSLVWPLPGYTYLSTHFGEVDAFGNPGHRGIDIPASEGTPILAAHSGTVLICGWNDSFGNQVLLDNGAGFSTRYAHMTAVAVTPGAVVTAGQVIGYVGSTGDSTGNHLHFEVSVGEILMDPIIYVSPNNKISTPHILIF